MPSKTEKRRIAKLTAQARADGIQAPQRKIKSRRGTAAKPTTAIAAQSADAGKIVLPTPERMAQRDAPVRGETGVFRVKPLIDKLRDKVWLDPSIHVRQAMHSAGEALIDCYHRAGLTGLGAQDLSRVVGGSGDPAYMTPSSENVMSSRQDFRRACKAMGWYEDDSGVAGFAMYRGAGRITVALLCQEMGFEDAARTYMPGGSTEERTGAAKERLRSGLWALISLWRIEAPRLKIAAFTLAEVAA